MSQTQNAAIAVVGIDIGKNSFHIVGHDERGAIVLRQKWSRGQVEARFANMSPCLVGMEACVGAHHDRAKSPFPRGYRRCRHSVHPIASALFPARKDLPGVSVGLLPVPDTECPRHDGQTSAGIFWSDPAYLAAAAAVSPGGTIRNMKVETFSPGLNGPGSWLLTGFKLLLLSKRTRQVFLAGGGFIAQQRNVVLVGGTGTGKSHLAIAIARSWCMT